MRSKEQFNLQMQWLDKELERYNNYKKEAVIERFNQLRSVLKQELKDVDLTMICDKFWGELTFTSENLNLDKGGIIAVIKLSLYRKNLIFRELIDLIEDHNCYFCGSYNPSFKIL